MPEESATLKGVGILITRPEPAASALANALCEAGAHCQVLPAMAINALPVSPQLKHSILNLDQFDQIIAISQHAAELALNQIDQYWPQLPINLHWHGIGNKTNQCLEDFGIVPEPCEHSPDHPLDSEGLLQHPLLQSINHQKILILKGSGGRPLLADSLTTRGAQVTEAELYERGLPSYSSEHIQQGLIKFSPDFVIALSGETVENMATLVQSHEEIASTGLSVLQKSTWILPSKRVSAIALKQGFDHYRIPSSLAVEDIIQAILG